MICRNAGKGPSCVEVGSVLSCYQWKEEEPNKLLDAVMSIKIVLFPTNISSSKSKGKLISPFPTKKI
jgi:hypothetical protein